MPKFLLIPILFIFALPGFTQEVAPISPHSGKVIILGAPAQPPAQAPAPVAAPAPGTEPAPEGIPSENADVDELQRTRLEQTAKLQKVEAITKPIAEPWNALEELRKLGHEQLGPSAFMDPKVIVILQRAHREGDMAKLPQEQVRGMILAQVKGKPLEQIFEKFPKLLDISVDVVKDKEAIPGLLGIFARKDDLKTYFYICIGMFLFGMFVKRRIIKPKWKFFKKFRYSITVSLVLTAISVYISWSFFSDELGPTVSIIAKHF